MTSEATATAVVRAAGSTFEFSPHNCFACGTLNTHGMQLELHIEPGRSWTELTLEPRFEGWEGIAHGGIVCTVLDEVMAWAPSSDDAWAVTAEMTIRYRSPATPGEELRAIGRVVGQRRRIYTVTGEVRGADGRVIAEGSGKYLGAAPSDKVALKERYGVVTGTGGE